MSYVVAGCLSIWLSFRPSVRPSVLLSVCLSVCGNGTASTVSTAALSPVVTPAKCHGAPVSGRSSIFLGFNSSVLWRFCSRFKTLASPLRVIPLFCYPVAHAIPLNTPPPVLGCLFLCCFGLRKMSTKVQIKSNGEIIAKVTNTDVFSSCMSVCICLCVCPFLYLCADR